MKVILVNPQIPQNTGNIVRTCAVTGADLTLVSPLGFSINSRWLKRAGLDYWEGVNVNVVDDIQLLLQNAPKEFYFLSSKAECSYAEKKFHSDDWFIFGSETTGLPKELMAQWPEKCITIPMISGQRCLNLATSVGIVLYEAWRQQNFGKI